MFLPDVEQNPQKGPYSDSIETMRSLGNEYPQIWHMFAYKPHATEHLARFTQEIMHGVRPHLLRERGLSRDQVSISGYWRRGRSEEGFRAWKSELARAETAG